MLIGVIVAHLGDYFKEYFENIFEKVFFNLIIFKNCTILLRFVLKNCQKYVIFKVFQVHLQVLLLFKKSSYMDITLLLKVQMSMK
jgi:hypothetical protein